MLLSTVYNCRACRAHQRQEAWLEDLQCQEKCGRLGRHREETKDITERTDNYIEGRSRIRLPDFCYWHRKREIGQWGKCSVIYCTEGLTEDRRECTWNSGGKYKVGYKWVKTGSGSIDQDWMGYWSEGISRATEMVVEMEIKICSLGSHEKMQNVLIKHKSGTKRHKLLNVTPAMTPNHSASSLRQMWIMLLTNKCTAVTKLLWTMTKKFGDV